jgi:hypothetical protein
MVARIAFDSTCSAQWWRGLAEGRGLVRHHWQTRVSYYRALVALVERGGPEVLPWHAVVDAVVPGGSRTTFYQVAGWRGGRSLWGRYAASGTADAAQIACRYRRGSDGRGRVATAVEESVRQWAADHRRLAGRLDHAPPMCAVEDLSLAWPGGLAGSRSYDRLASVIAMTALTGPFRPVVAAAFPARPVALVVPA